MPLGKKCGSSVSERLTWTLYRRGFVRAVDAAATGGSALDVDGSDIPKWICGIHVDEDVKSWSLNPQFPKKKTSRGTNANCNEGSDGLRRLRQEREVSRVAEN
ncbi:hypothetical protein MRX96_040706 [Rhipicephalus microplus]